MPNKFNLKNLDIAWCPGCGNFGILDILKEALTELKIKPEKLVITSGIGQASKTPHYLKTNFFNGLHGRQIPLATAIKASNPELTVIAEGGDGDTYGEGGNHFIHAIRRNVDITNIVHNNMVYGLTKGQASPTSIRGFKTKIQVNGVFLEPFNPVAVAIAGDASFVARISIGDRKESKKILKKAIQHRGYALIDIFQPCPVFNKLNTYKWFKENTYYLDKSHNPNNREIAFAKAIEKDSWPLGIFYINTKKKTFTENEEIYSKNKKPLFAREHSIAKIKSLINKKQ